MRLSHLLGLPAVVLLTAPGCSSSDQSRKTVPVKGVVRYKGEPLAGAYVTFFQPEANVSAVGRTDDAGRFTLTTFAEGDGAVPGSQKVTVRKIEVIDRAKPGYDYVEKGETAPPPEERWVTPQRYAKPETSDLTADVQSKGKNEFEFDLKD